MRLPTHHGRTSTDVAMTPMIDVVFQLLIFFICTASFQQVEELLPMGLAVTGGETATPTVEKPEQQRIVLRATHIDGQTRWLVNGRPADSLHEVENALRDVSRSDRSMPITLDVAQEVPLGEMIDVYDLCRQAGLEKIEFAVAAK